ncbi:tRNA (adenosine(37)-N6)-threonylcarbamoyltransferase complex ATPase subunit type 1 TsaE [Paramicrobacterium agarici]|uniref:tRNA (adenosine(37)-N6)-threonylcarbamoyltransferase complex ATPase subunit type 1 TsaE n=1 Tax=Paramicrobacterium agarici TaxID=630514 RepID=UPI001167CFEA|nr:tRNA threonylcarbamoyl adenosine modification protein YjeE [Microbacterium agarici]
MIEIPSTTVCATTDEMHELGVELGRTLHAGDLLVLTGPLGAGKTTLTRGIGEGLGVRGSVTSPTFVLARTHPNLAGGAPLVHVDAYRLSDAVELDDLDIDFERSVVVVEWGRGVLAGVAEQWLEVEIERPTGAAGSVADSAPDVSTGTVDSAAASNASKSELQKTAVDSSTEDDHSLQVTFGTEARAGAEAEARAGAEAEAGAEVDEPRIVRVKRVRAGDGAENSLRAGDGAENSVRTGE